MVVWMKSSKVVLCKNNERSRYWHFERKPLFRIMRVNRKPCVFVEWILRGIIKQGCDEHLIRATNNKNFLEREKEIVRKERRSLSPLVRFTSIFKTSQLSCRLRRSLPPQIGKIAWLAFLKLMVGVIEMLHDGFVKIIVYKVSMCSKTVTEKWLVSPIYNQVYVYFVGANIFNNPCQLTV